MMPSRNENRSLIMDQLMGGLEQSQVAAAIRLFPSVFECLFVCDDNFDSESLTAILRPRQPMSDEERAVYDMLLQFINECTIQVYAVGSVD